jgi:hypothetical protein
VYVFRGQQADWTFQPRRRSERPQDETIHDRSRRAARSDAVPKPGRMVRLWDGRARDARAVAEIDGARRLAR